MKEIETPSPVEYDPQQETIKAVENFEIFWKKQPMNAERRYLGLPEPRPIEEVRAELSEIIKQKAHEQRESW